MTNEIETVWFHDSVKVTHEDNMNSTLHVDGKVKKFYVGETAWMDAERDGYDLAIERMYRK